MCAHQLCWRVVPGYKRAVVERFECFDDGRIEVSAALAQDFSDSFVDWPGLLVRSSMRERVEYVSQRDQATR
jgi:hypothetical protein